MKILPRLTRMLDIPLGKKIVVNLWTLVLIGFSLPCGYAFQFLTAYLCAFLHELAHITSAKLLHVKISTIKFYPFGMCATLDGNYIKSSEKEFFVAISGPIASLILFWICDFATVYIPQMVFVRDLNLWICIINLIPVLPLDGGRILKSMLISRFGIITAYNFMLKISRIIIALLGTFAIFLIFISKFNFPLVMICAFLMQNLCFEQKAVSLVALKEILKSSQNNKDQSKLRTRILTVKETDGAYRFINKLNYDCYWIIYVTDKSGRISSTLTETQILSALSEKGLLTKYKDITG